MHAMHQMFESPDVEAAILVDASNAFNTLNRENALRNIQYLCPPLSTVLINTYREDVQLFIDGETMISEEGTTQGDPLAMAMYAIGILPLIQSLSNENTKQVWYADDSAACGDLTNLRFWWDHLVKVGPNYGYQPNASKTWLVVKEGKFDDAISAFEGTGVNITLEGKRHLGGAVGTRSFIESYVQKLVSEWVRELERLSSFAVSQPHAAYAAFTHGFTSKWTFLVRTTPDIGTLLKPLEDTIRLKFLPALTGQNAPNNTERDLLALPARLGGIGRGESERSRAWLLFTTNIFNIRRDGPNCNCGLQTDCHPHRRETRPALQQNSILDSLQTQLLTTALCHYVHQGIKVLIPSPSWYDWGSY